MARILGQCAKQVVTCTIITADGETFIGENYCADPQPVCPRELGGFASGEGYELCKDVCEQVGHAEKVALSAATGKDLEGATAFLDGHSYCCFDCREALFGAGIKSITINRPQGGK